MKTGAVNGVPVIFVLDEFERFACRKPQTLLYALLDLCQVWEREALHMCVWEGGAGMFVFLPYEPLVFFEPTGAQKERALALPWGVG